MVFKVRCCAECGGSFQPERNHATCCSVSCRKAFNNRRMLRGAALYDLFMCLRYQRGVAKAQGVWTLVCALAYQYRLEDKRERAGRHSWVSPERVGEQLPWLLGKQGVT